MRKPLVCGNWKMYKTAAEGRALAREIRNGRRGAAEGVDVVVCPPFTAIPAVAEALEGSSIAWGSQNCAAKAEGALTGEISPPMLVDLGCRFAILGHSERRQFFQETDQDVREKLQAVLGEGLTPIVCVGESLEEREANRTEEVVDRQIRGAYDGIPAAEAARTIVAYEPVWAIGTGKTASPDQAEAVHRRIRVTLSGVFGEQVAVGTRILYGGSVKPGNAAELFSQPNIDGGLIGGASLKAADFLAIVEAGCSTQ
ncbi:MAG: triose-phosphate isomerase [Gemmatimonadetes bacterium]|nr:triose-phosphate isomerase [Gemmatimonadota bacterium]